MGKSLLVGGLLLLISLQSFSQRKSASDILNTRKQRVEQHYKNSFVAHVLTGKKYEFERSKAKTHPLFLSKRPRRGTLVYDGIQFKPIDIEYNLFTQQIIVLLESKNNERFVSIDNEKVSSFSIEDYNFIHFSGDSIMAAGMYQLGYDGQHSTLFIKNRKSQEKILTKPYLTFEYHPKKSFFVKNKQGTFEIKGKKSFLSAFSHDVEMAALLKSKKIKLRKKQLERQLIYTLSLYDKKLQTGK